MIVCKPYLGLKQNKYDTDAQVAKMWYQYIKKFIHSALNKNSTQFNNTKNLLL